MVNEVLSFGGMWDKNRVLYWKFRLSPQLFDAKLSKDESKFITNKRSRLNEPAFFDVNIK